MAKIPMTSKKRLVIAFMIFCGILAVLSFRVGYIQIVKGEEYAKKAIEQQTKDEVVEAKRGDIVDRNGNKLAASVLRYSVWVRPGMLNTSQSKEENSDKVKKVSANLAQILELSPEEVEKKLTSGVSLVKIAKYLERDKADAIRAYARKENVDAVSVTEETKRYYPLGDFASHTLGSVTDDNNGLSGLEQYYNSYLKGVPGRWIQNKDVNGRTLSYGYAKYYDTQDGATLVLTLDVVIQNYAEASVAKAMKEYKADAVRCIVMDPKTGEILAVAASPSFDPNDSRKPLNEEEAKALAGMDEAEQLKHLNKMWRSPLFNDTYVPGSTMKLFTTAMCLEEGLTNPNEHFHCSGSINVSGTTLKCWRFDKPHGDQTLKQAVGNSCNPVFVQLAQRVGIEKYYDYMGLFGISQPTGVDYPGEAVSLMQNIDSAGPVGLATMGFGQGIAVTPIELLTGVCSLGNDGMLMQPHLVKEIKGANGKSIKKFKPIKVKQAVSQETAREMCNIMEFVVTDGGAGNAKIKGYRVGGKTGTANIEAEDNKIVASFVGMAPMDNPRLAVLFIVENPDGAIYGSTVAAPGGAEVLEKSLRYLNVKGSEDTSDDSKKMTTTPKVAGMGLKEAKALLSEKGLNYKISPDPGKEEEFTIKDQYPKAGEAIEEKGTVYLYSE
jgi:stage V sporulation protein D (sporulation-specific penicillin-binding protein)